MCSSRLSGRIQQHLQSHEGWAPTLRRQIPERKKPRNLFATMVSARQNKPPRLRYWRVSVPGGKRPEYVGIVEAPDQQSAEAIAVKRFRLTDEERERLVVRTRD